ARTVFERMPHRDLVSWNSIVSAYARNGYMDESKFLFDQMPERDVISWTALVIAGEQCCSIDLALAVFEKIPHRNTVSWNSVIAAYAQSGSLGDAKAKFDELPERDMCSWTSLVPGFARAGLFDESMVLLERMPQLNVPDKTTLASVLTSCSHGGMVCEALALFSGMACDFGVAPAREHFCCVIDIFARSGQLILAHGIAAAMPFEAHDVVWGILLAACAASKDEIAGVRAAEKALEMDPGGTFSYVLLANLY
ncbi:hypothetical protein SELMODRAFT_24174, partial [Selaginella moellendorffii]